ncbi:hypothetical protein HDU97_010042 [Phlyctochytrium planicorne]|nr:hypothetical protein HDU97_010042 [Phlyctochytrium planicorne]
MQTSISATLSLLLAFISLSTGVVNVVAQGDLPGEFGCYDLPETIRPSFSVNKSIPFNTIASPRGHCLNLCNAIGTSASLFGVTLMSIPWTVRCYCSLTAEELSPNQSPNVNACYRCGVGLADLCGFDNGGTTGATFVYRKQLTDVSTTPKSTSESATPGGKDTENTTRSVSEKVTTNSNPNELLTSPTVSSSGVQDSNLTATLSSPLLSSSSGGGEADVADTNSQTSALLPGGPTATATSIPVAQAQSPASNKNLVKILLPILIAIILLVAIIIGLLIFRRRRHVMDTESPKVLLGSSASRFEGGDGLSGIFPTREDDLENEEETELSSESNTSQDTRKSNQRQASHLSSDSSQMILDGLDGELSGGTTDSLNLQSPNSSTSMHSASQSIVGPMTSGHANTADANSSSSTRKVDCINPEDYVGGQSLIGKRSARKSHSANQGQTTPKGQRRASVKSVTKSAAPSGKGKRKPQKSDTSAESSSSSSSSAAPVAPLEIEGTYANASTSSSSSSSPTARMGQVSTWTTTQVAAALLAIGIDEQSVHVLLSKFCKTKPDAYQIISDNNVGGVSLILLTESALESMGLHSPQMRREVLDAVDQIVMLPLDYQSSSNILPGYWPNGDGSNGDL